MSRDFTVDKYRELCETLLGCKYSIVPVNNYLQIKKAGRESNHTAAIMRHDIDRKLGNSLRMAELEHAMGIRSTYYFRYPYTFIPEIVRQIRDFGHEIGYHYEVLGKTKGDPEKAIHLFEQELNIMRQTCDIKTICMHGNPLSRYDERDLWKHYDFREFGIDGEAYLSFQDSGLKYFTDTGRNWNGSNSMRDVMSGTGAVPPQLNTTDDLICWIEASGKECLYLTVHPERWARGKGEWAVWYIMDLVMNAGKAVLVAMR